MTAAPSNFLHNIPSGLRDPLIEEYNKLARNFREGRWEPAELSGGKFCEIVYSILKGHVDGSFAASPYKPRSMEGECKKLENEVAFPRSIRIQIPRMLVALYEVRNNRNVGHVGGDVDPNHMDATLVFSMCQWIMAELVRVFHAVSLDEAADIVESIIDRPVPILWKVGGRTRVLNTSLSAKDKMMALMYGSTEDLTVQEVPNWIEYSNASVFKSKVAKPAHKVGLIDYDQKTGKLKISPTGISYVETNIKLTL